MDVAAIAVTANGAEVLSPLSRLTQITFSNPTLTHGVTGCHPFQGESQAASDRGEFMSTILDEQLVYSEADSFPPEVSVVMPCLNEAETLEFFFLGSQTVSGSFFLSVLGLVRRGP